MTLPATTAAPDKLEPSTRTGGAQRPRQPLSLRRRRRREGLTGYLFIAPVVFLLAVFQFWPLIRGAELSFTKSGFFGGSTWNGVGNYREILHDAELGRAFANSAKYTVLVLLGVPLAMITAAMLNARRLRLRAVYRTLFFLPVVVMPAALGLAWSTLLNGDYGPVNTVLSWVGVSGRSWLQDSQFALIAVGIVGVWSTLGYNIVLFLAGLQAIPRELYEAAELDGAGRIRQFVNVTVPLLTPTSFFVTVTSTLTAMQMFDLMYIMIGANANQGQRNPVINDAQTVVYLFYEYGFVRNDRGYASAIAMVLLIVVLAMTVLQFRLQRKWVHYA